MVKIENKETIKKRNNCEKRLIKVITSWLLKLDIAHGFLIG